MAGRVVWERRLLTAASDDAHAVTTVLHRVSRPRGRGLLLFHGAGGDLDQPRLVALADAVAADGHPVVRANLPFREQRSGPPPRAERSVAGLVAVAGAVAATHGPRRGWVVGGASYGGRVATMAAADGGLDAVGLLCLGYPLHPPGRPDRLRVEHLPRVRVPLLVLQGTHDAFGTPAELAPHLRRPLAAARVHEVPGADHGLVVPASRSPDGRRHRAPAVAAGLAPVVVAWMRELSSA